ncbi:MAG TPA: RluA family pseudouridine synthase, partial [Solirubrobacteraceae bacterium]|nr:RluA family pseudouridine synthase [Solirubrobacteraceae bacterium]
MSDEVDFTIAFQDEHLMVVDKGSGVVVHPARGHRENTLAQMLAPLLAGGEDEEGEFDRTGIVHRL